jgi:hypothetical protein
VSDFQQVGQAEMITEYHRLLEAQRIAVGGEDREAADHALKLFLMLNATGRIGEWFARKATDDVTRTGEPDVRAGSRTAPTNEKD